jgi:hypothetical protein
VSSTPDDADAPAIAEAERMESPAPHRLLAYRFPPGVEFDGRLLGLLQRVDEGGPLRIVDLLFVARDLASGEPLALSGRGGGSGNLVAGQAGYRLGAAERARATARARRIYAEPDLVTRQAGALPPGGAVAALIVESAWARAVGEAVEQSGGSLLVDEPAPASRLDALEGLAPRLVAVV